MIAGLKQLMKFILDGLVGAGGREDQAKMHCFSLEIDEIWREDQAKMH